VRTSNNSSVILAPGHVFRKFPTQAYFAASVLRMGKTSGSGSGMNNPDHNSESLETIFWVEFFDADPIRIRDPE
jgi:hypothetical protein